MINAIPQNSSTSKSFTPLFVPCNAVPQPDFIAVTIEPAAFAAGEIIKITATGIAAKTIDSATIFAGFSNARNDDIGSVSKSFCSHLRGGQSCPVGSGIKFTITTHVKAPHSIIGTALSVRIVEKSTNAPLFCSVARLLP
ncbi:hypothetical protein G9A89_022390 [Geosiphon pyriformis]|nr:hypothetical protein G9A89_022390 [Geosiphon pyriformis]